MSEYKETKKTEEMEESVEVGTETENTSCSVENRTLLSSKVKIVFCSKQHEHITEKQV